MPEEINAIQVDQNYIIELAQELIQIPAENPPGDCSDMAEKILKELSSIGISNIKTYDFNAKQFKHY